jgi:hypothetical protein
MKATIRCAIYTRKSSEEGLGQSFNSLHAQREACEAHVLSQKHEGWHVLSAQCDDGGFSGGNMTRPGLKKLLDDIAAGKVDTVVVYKVDGLTRSLADFAKIVEAFDGKGVSFVSVTQQFNTTIRRRGSEVRLVLENGEPSEAKPIPSLAKAVAWSRHWADQIVSGKLVTMDLAKSAGVNKIHARRMLRCAALSPNLTAQILEGRQPVDLTFDKLTRNLPLSWVEQLLLYRVENSGVGAGRINRFC